MELVLDGLRMEISCVTSNQSMEKLVHPPALYSCCSEPGGHMFHMEDGKDVTFQVPEWLVRTECPLSYQQLSGIN